MSSLCERKNATFNKSMKRPSPKLRKNLNPCNEFIPAKKPYIANCIKRISLLTLQPVSVQASMTVEAALVIPLFCFFIIYMGSAMEMIRLHGNLEVALWDAGRQVGIYGELLDSENATDDPEECDPDNRVEAVVISYTYIRNQIRKQLGDEYLKQAPLDKGIDGLQFLESSIRGDNYEIVVTYKIKPLLSLLGFHEFRMANKYYGHLWTGYEIPGTKEDVEYVYVTGDAKVYHTNRECTHIRLSIHMIQEEEIPKGYKACEKCVEGKNIRTDMFYICTEGKHYHSNQNCPGIKRTVYCIAKENVYGYRECSRCRETKTGENYESRIVGKMCAGRLSPMDRLA